MLCISLTNYLQMVTMQNSRSQLNVLLTTGPPILEVLNQGSGSTVTRNFMSWNKAYSIFPVPTFRLYKGYLVDPCETPIGNAVYRLGWRLQDVQWPEETKQDKSLGPLRRIGDKYTWCIAFDTDGVDGSLKPDYILESSTFSIENYLQPGTLLRCYKFSAELVRSCILKYEHVVGGDHPHHLRSTWPGFLHDRLNGLTRVELLRLDHSHRPAAYHDLMRGAARHDEIDGGILEKPLAWTYYDEEILKWFRAWESIGVY